MEKGSGTVLVVDTDRANVSVIATMLEKSGITVYSAFDGEQAEQINSTQQPDVIVSELMLPKMDGFTLFEKVRTGEGKMPEIMIVSDLKNEDTVTRALGLSVLHYFKKPYFLTELIGIIKAKLKGEKHGL